MRRLGIGLVGLLRAAPLVGIALAIAPTLVVAQAAAEPEPRLAARELLPKGTRTQGSGWRIEPQVQIESHLGRFVFETDWGRLEAHGSEIALERIAEMPTIPRLEAISRVDVFADALVKSAERTGQAVVRVVSDPVGTVQGLPSGIARLVRRTADRVRDVSTNVSDAVARQREQGAGGEAESESDPTDPLVDFGKELAGVNRARRELARELGIDPYTRNPLIQERLERLAWAAVAGGISMKAALGNVGGFAGEALATTTRLDKLVWEASPQEIRRVLEQRLVERGAEAREAREFLRNGAFTPTQQVAFVDALVALGTPQGLGATLELARGVRSEAHARFLVDQLRLIGRHLERGDAVVELVALELAVAARTRRGQYLVTLPVDRLSWTEDLRAIATEARSLPSRRRIVVTGSVSPLARRELQRAGFSITVGAPRV